MKKLIILFLLASNVAFAQTQNQIDSLHNVQSEKRIEDSTRQATWMAINGAPLPNTLTIGDIRFLPLALFIRPTNSDVALAYAPISHAHTISDVTGLTLALSNRVTLTGSEVITGKTLGSFNYAADAQSNDTYVISLSPAPASYTTGMIIVFKANTANTTGCSVNVNGLGAKTMLKRLNTTMATGDILAGMICMCVYDGANFILINPVVN